MPARKTRQSRPTVVVFVRHGLTPTTGRLLPGRAGGLHLSESGLAQAEEVAERIARLHNKVAAVYASPLTRARETAAPIARRFGLRVEVERGLQDCDSGSWTGAELNKLSKLPEWQTVMRWPSGFRFPGGESFTEMQARVVGTTLTLRDRHPGATIVVVSHADPIKAVVADAMGAHLDLFQRIVISPCSTTAIQYAPSGPTVLSVNTVGEARAE